MRRQWRCFQPRHRRTWHPAWLLCQDSDSGAVATFGTRRERACRGAKPLDAIATNDPQPAAPAALAPLPDSQRIEALDVVRGFALFGIFLMNVEWFNRPYASFEEGMPRGLTGIDWLASWFVAYFVFGKFWTIFALLFGMGFSVMLTRVERAGGQFLRVYLRRIVALAVFGAAHYIFVWEGDILFSYAAGALCLLIVLYGKVRPIAIACAALVTLALLPNAELLLALAGGVLVAGLLGLYLRSEKRLGRGEARIPVFSFVVLVLGLLLTLAAAALWLLADGTVEERTPLTALGPLLLLAGMLSWRYHAPASKRSLRLAVAVYVFASLGATAIGVVQHFTPDPLAVLSRPQEAATATSTATATATAKRAQRAAEIKASRDKSLAEYETRKREEIQALTAGSYLDTVDLRARRFPEKAASDAVLAVLLVGMFLLGAWFVRSGTITRPHEHLPFFRKLALYGLPAGIGLGLVTGFIAMSHTPGERGDGWLIARGLLTLGNLPACLGYVGLVVTMLHTRTALSRIRVLAAPGRMALTNYLMQSLISVFVFYGFGLGHWGLPRAWQIVFVVAVFAAQVAFSHWWLARFRYGPMEWLWRGFTYRQVPPLRVADRRAAA